MKINVKWPDPEGLDTKCGGISIFFYLRRWWDIYLEFQVMSLMDHTLFFSCLPEKRNSLLEVKITCTDTRHLQKTLRSALLFFD